MLGPSGKKVILRVFFSAWGILLVCKISGLPDTPISFLATDDTFLTNMQREYFPLNI